MLYQYGPRHLLLSPLIIGRLIGEEKLCLRRLSIRSARRELPRPRRTLLAVRQLWFCWRLLPSMLFGVTPIWQSALGSTRFHLSSWRDFATLLLRCSSTRSFSVTRASTPPPPP